MKEAALIKAKTRTFEMFDTDNNNILTKSELDSQNYSMSIGKNPIEMKSDQIALLLKQFDKNNDGVISKEEFTKSIVKK